MRAWIRKYPFTTYYFGALAISLVVIAADLLIVSRNPGEANVLPELWKWTAAGAHTINVVTLARFAFETHHYSILLIYVFAAAPMIAAIVVTFALGGSGLVRRLVARLKPWGKGVSAREAGKIYAVMVLAYLAIFAVLLAVCRMQPGAFQVAYSTLGGTPLLAFLTAIVLLFLDEGGTLEELGWRGFAWPLLQQRMSPRRASILLGVLWSAWHLPREIPTLLQGTKLGLWLFGQVHFFVYCTVLAVIIGYAVNRTGGSVLPAIIIHGGTNVWSKANALNTIEKYMPPHVDFRLLLLLVIAAIIYFAAGSELGRRPSASAEAALGVPAGS